MFYYTFKLCKKQYIFLETSIKKNKCLLPTEITLWLLNAHVSDEHHKHIYIFFQRLIHLNPFGSQCPVGIGYFCTIT